MFRSDLVKHTFCIPGTKLDAGEEGEQGGKFYIQGTRCLGICGKTNTLPAFSWRTPIFLTCHMTLAPSSKTKSQVNHCAFAQVRRMVDEEVL